MGHYWSRKHHDVTVLLFVLLAVVCVPIPLGSNRPYGWLGFELFVFGVFAFWAIGAVFYRNRVRYPGPVKGMLVAFLAWLGFIFLQTVELPTGLVSVLNPLAYSVQRDLALISVEGRSTLSIDMGNTYNELLKYSAYVAFFCLLISTVTTRARLLWSVGILILAGLLEAVFGIYSHLTGFVLLPETEAAVDLRAGTFVNPNHFSNLLTMILGLVLGLVTAAINTNVDHRYERDRNTDLNTALLMLLVGVAVVIIAAVFTTGSRAPLVLFTVGYGVMLVLAYSTKHTARGEFVLAPIVAAGVATVVVLIGFNESMVQLLGRNIFRDERILQNLLGLDLFSAAWLTGVGAGNYRWAFSMFRNDELRFAIYDHAHNDYLETAVEQGVIGTLLLGVAVVLILRELYKGYRVRRTPLLRGVIFGCLMGVVYMLLHAFIDFNFRIPANAVYFFALSALGIAACRVDRRRRSRSTRHKERELSDG